MADMDFERRFGGIARLYGDSCLLQFAAKHVCVIGIGGVGSWAAEALARSAVGRITLIDLDHVAESNTNRQIHALEGEYGKAKVLAMAERIQAINPACKVAVIEEFITPENVSLLLPACDAVLDAIDIVSAKAALIAHCRDTGITIVTTGAAGGRRDPTRVQVVDLARTQHDALAASLRARLRRDYGFSRDLKEAFGVQCVFSDEPIARSASIAPTCVAGATPAPQAPQGLNCAGYGSAVTVTATFGMFAAARVLDRLTLD